jgi:hypothetical protein
VQKECIGRLLLCRELKTKAMKNTIIELSNGKLVANFSSPHPFTFTDGSVLPPVSNEDSERLKIQFNEVVHPNGDTELSFELTEAVREQMGYWMDKWNSGEVNVVFCPLPMITAIKNLNPNSVIHSPFRSVRMEDRIAKLVSIEKQCI